MEIGKSEVYALPEWLSTDLALWPIRALLDEPSAVPLFVPGLSLEAVIWSEIQ